LILNAISKSGKPIIGDNKTKTNKIIFKEGYTLKDVVKEMNQKKENNKKMLIKKELAKYLLRELNEISKNEYISLVETINNAIDIDTLNIIIRLLNKTYCFGNEFNNEIIKKEIKKDALINKMIN